MEFNEEQERAAFESNDFLGTTNPGRYGYFPGTVDNNAYMILTVQERWSAWIARARIAHEREQVLEARVKELEADAMKLRDMFAIAKYGRTVYGDDGEMQDCSELPMIDFHRDSVQEIENKINERYLLKLAREQSAARAALAKEPT